MIIHITSSYFRNSSKFYQIYTAQPLTIYFEDDKIDLKLSKLKLLENSPDVVNISDVLKYIDISQTHLTLLGLIVSCYINDHLNASE